MLISFREVINSDEVDHWERLALVSDTEWVQRKVERNKYPTSGNILSPHCRRRNHYKGEFLCRLVKMGIGNEPHNDYLFWRNARLEFRRGETKCVDLERRVPQMTSMDGTNAEFLCSRSWTPEGTKEQGTKARRSMTDFAFISVQNHKVVNPVRRF